VGTPIGTGSFVWAMALRTKPQKLFLSAFGHFAGRGIVGMPFHGEPWVFSHRLTLTEIATFAFAVGADHVTSTPRQVVNNSLPFMVPAALMEAA